MNCDVNLFGPVILRRVFCAEELALSEVEGIYATCCQRDENV
jgi:hypothetical protein